MSKWTILGVALACGASLLTTDAFAGRRHCRHHHHRAHCCAVQPTTCCTASTVAAAPQMAQTPPAPGSYQSFSYEPGGVVPAPSYTTIAPTVEGARDSYRDGSFKALGKYGR